MEGKGRKERKPAREEDDIEQGRVKGGQLGHKLEGGFHPLSATLQFCLGETYNFIDGCDPSALYKKKTSRASCELAASALYDGRTARRRGGRAFREEGRGITTRAKVTE